MLNRSSIARTLLKQASSKAPRTAVALAPRAAGFSSSARVGRPDVKLMGVAMANQLAKDPNYKPERKVGRWGCCCGGVVSRGWVFVGPSS